MDSPVLNTNFHSSSFVNITQFIKQKHREKHLKKLAKKLRVNVVFTGWIPFSLVPSYIATCKICVIPHIKSSFTDTTLPHKLFQYMACGKPIVVSNVTPIARIVEKYQCGLVFDGTKESLAKCLTSLLENESLSKKMGENGLSAVTSSLNMEKEGQKLINLYSSIIDRSGKRK